MKKRGQAAMEFLMTYGWAILAAIIVVGVLWYIIGNPGNLAGDKFVLSTPLTAEAKQLTAGAGNSVAMEIRNGAGETIYVRTLTITNCGANDYTAAPIAHPTGNVTTYTMNCGTDLISDDRFNGDIEVIYRAGTSALDQISTGTVSGQVP